jgi:hypothetical protein
LRSHVEVRGDVDGLRVAITPSHNSTCTIGVDELRLHVAHEADDGVCEQSRALKHENREQSPEEWLGDVNATRLATGLLRVALESPVRSGRNLRLGREFGVEDGREARWQVVMTLILHRHLLVEVAIVGLLKVWRRRRQWAFLVLTRR